METALGFMQWLWVLSGGVILGSVIYSAAIERYWLDVRKLDISLPRLPREFSGFRIVLISDLHLGFFYGPRNVLKALEVINELKPDLICMTGDILDSRISLKTLEPVVPLFKKLKAPSGKFAVLGNHDYRAGAAYVARGLEGGGFCLLKNSNAVLEKGKNRVYLVGLDDIQEGRPGLKEAVAGIPEHACKILLVHEPDFADLTKKFSIDLQLSGHSHGGQVRFPFVGPVVTTSLGKKYVSGLYHLGGLKLYTNAGLGTTILPLRFFCRPEITVITLKSG